MKKKLLAIPYEIYKTKNMVKIFKIKKIFPPRKTILRKISFGMIPIITLAIFLAPISPILKVENGELAVKTEVNKIFATDIDEVFPSMWWVIDPNDDGTSQQQNTEENYNEPIKNIETAPTQVKFDVIVTAKNSADLNTGSGDSYSTDKNISSACTYYADHDDNGEGFKTWFELNIAPMSSATQEQINAFYDCLASNTDMFNNYGSYDILEENGLNPNNGFWIQIVEDGKADSGESGWDQFNLKQINQRLRILETGFTMHLTTPEGTLKPETKYNLRLRFDEDGDTDDFYSKIISFTTPKTGDALSVNSSSSAGEEITGDYSLGCSLIKGLDGIVGCVAGLFYIIWEITSWIAHLAANFLDFFISYSLNSSAYRSEFVTKSWGVIRDVANIFFIIALLYIAIKTVLNLNVSNNKRLIGAIVIIALVINFSLFITQVVIDSSNILAKVFYNQIPAVDENGKTIDPSSPDYMGYKSVTVSLVSAFDPQDIIKTEAQYKASRGMFIFITLLLIFLTLYCAYMFFVVSILFVGRVVSLWVSMIFSPLAFISYTLPFNMPFGHKEWWDNLLKNAFLAPIFIFFLLIIIMFAKLTQTMNFIQYDPNSITANGLILTIMGTLIPFAIIFIMLTKAKTMAVEYSGEIGKMFSKIGGMATSFVGGGVVGFAAGALAKTGRATVGRAGSAIANSKWADKLANSNNRFGRLVGQKAQDVGEYAGKKSFDVRGSTLGALAAQKSGLKVGKAKQGGFEGAKSEKEAKREARKNQLEERASKQGNRDIANAKSDVNKAKNEQQKLKDNLAPEINALEKLTSTLEKSLAQKSQALGADHPETKETYLKLQQANAQKKNLMEGKDYKYEGDIIGTKKVATGETRKAKRMVDGTAKRMVEMKGLDGKPILDQYGIKQMKEEEYKTKVEEDYDEPIMEDQAIYDTTKAKTIGYGDKNSVHYSKDKSGNSISDYEKNIIPEKEREVNMKQNALHEKREKVKMHYVKDFNSGLNHTVNMITSLGEYSVKGGKQTAESMSRVQRINSSSGAGGNLINKLKAGEIIGNSPNPAPSNGGGSSENSKP